MVSFFQSPAISSAKHQNIAMPHFLSLVRRGDGSGKKKKKRLSILCLCDHRENLRCAYPPSDSRRLGRRNWVPPRLLSPVLP